MRNKKVTYLTQAALIAALYVVLTYVANAFGLANHAIQVRFSEFLALVQILMTRVYFPLVLFLQAYRSSIFYPSRSPRTLYRLPAQQYPDWLCPAGHSLWKSRNASGRARHVSAAAEKVVCADLSHRGKHTHRSAGSDLRIRPADRWNVRPSLLWLLCPHRRRRGDHFLRDPRYAAPECAVQIPPADL